MITIRNNSESMIEFRINALRGSEGDETAMYQTFVSFLNAEFFPFKTTRLAFVDKESDDAIWGVIISNEDYDFIKKVVDGLKEEENV